MNTTDIVIIRNTRPAGIYLPSVAALRDIAQNKKLMSARSMRDSLLLKPGDNEVLREIWDVIAKAKNPSVEIWLKAGWLQVRDPAPARASAGAGAPAGAPPRAGASAPAGAPAGAPVANPHAVDPTAAVPPPTLLTDVPDEEALALVQACSDLEVIQRWGANETRKPIIDALLQRYKDLGGVA